MRILDLDLDFFLDDVAHWRESGDGERFLENDPEESFVIEPPTVWTNWLSLANDGLMTRKASDE